MDKSRSKKIAYRQFAVGTLEAVLDLHAPPFIEPKRAFGQLRYIERYVGALGCTSIAIEPHYIDRDYIEDHSVFYSKSHHQYSNSCQRIHFFRGRGDVKAALTALRRDGRNAGDATDRLRREEFSRHRYLGFMVVKPLEGCPVGRTVIATYPADGAPGFIREYSGTRRDVVHLAGVELDVVGLPFQQQDVGVSACATTALWSSIQKLHDFERLPAVTPAQITSLAARSLLPFGQAMPSEGLNIGQMCQAVHAVGLSPNLIPIRDFDSGRGYLHSILKSGLAPVLILTRPSGHHAVTVTGIKVRTPHRETSVENSIDDVAGDVVALYIHDDRIGPYVRAKIGKRGSALTLRLTPLTGSDLATEQWAVSHILVPIHHKIRLSFFDLRKFAIHLCNRLIAFSEAYRFATTGKQSSPTTVTMESRIVRGHGYLSALRHNTDAISDSAFHELSETAALPRYIGLVSLSSKDLGQFDIVVDSTSTRKNPHFVVVIARSPRTLLSAVFAKSLAEELRCHAIISGVPDSDS